jgi:hypothetical protein
MASRVPLRALEPVGGRRNRQGVAFAGVVVLAALVAGCSSGKSQGSPVPPVSVPVRALVSYVARNSGRVDRLQWTVTGPRLSGTIDSRWFTSADPIDLQGASVTFNGTLQGTHLTLSPDDGSATWSGTFDGSHLVLQWTSSGHRLTTTFLPAGTGDFDTAVQVLSGEVAAASDKAAAAKAAVAAARAAQITQTKQALKAAKRAAALARAEAGRRSAAKAAAHRRQHPHP